MLCAVFVGPWYGLAQALISSIIRNLFGTGSFFAFPGSMIGVLLASVFYMYRKHIFMVAVGEVIGTGIIGSLLCTNGLGFRYARFLRQTLNDSVYYFKFYRSQLVIYL